MRAEDPSVAIAVDPTAAIYIQDEYHLTYLWHQDPGFTTPFAHCTKLCNLEADKFGDCLFLQCPTVALKSLKKVAIS